MMPCFRMRSLTLSFPSRMKPRGLLPSRTESWTEASLPPLPRPWLPAPPPPSPCSVLAVPVHFTLVATVS